MDSIEKTLKEISNLGWDFNLEYDAKTKLYKMILCRPEWVTNNLYAAIACPSWDNEDIYTVLLFALAYCKG